jgi:hypothetical protein
MVGRETGEKALKGVGWFGHLRILPGCRAGCAVHKYQQGNSGFAFKALGDSNSPVPA